MTSGRRGPRVEALTHRPRIRYLNGLRLRRALIAGARHLIAHRDHLNTINVFPVADSDTGTNMAGTMRAVVDGILPSRERGLNRMLRTIADLALSGARGCSGTILAQFLHGLAQETVDAVHVTTRIFALGVRRAVAYPYEAVSEPREGTILTVLRDWGDALSEWGGRSDDFIEVLHHAYQAALRSLEKTKEKLAVLARAGVVDAGAQGLVHLLAGITAFISHGRIREMDRLDQAVEDDDEPASEALEKPAFRYCTQFVIEGSDLDPKAVRAALADLGDSLIVAGSPAKAKIHVHTDVPAEALRRIEGHGRVASQRVEDMVAQYRAAHDPHAEVALVVDSSCDLPAEVWQRHNIHIVPCLLLFDGRTYIDKLTVDPQALFAMLHRTREGHATTSQPAPADFKGRLEFLARHYRSTVVLTLPASISGTHDSARTGARLAGGDVTVIDSMTTSVGMGLIVRRAAEAIEAGATKDQVVALVNRLVPGVHIHVTVRSLENLVRSGRVSRVKGLVAGLLDLKPLIRLNVETGGRPVHGGTVRGVRGGRRRILETLKREISPATRVEFGIAHANALEDALWFRDRIAETFALARETFVVEATTVLANHIGEGSLGLAWLAAEP